MEKKGDGVGDDSGADVGKGGAVLVNGVGLLIGLGGVGVGDGGGVGVGKKGDGLRWQMQIVSVLEEGLSVRIGTVVGIRWGGVAEALRLRIWLMALVVR